MSYWRLDLLCSRPRGAIGALWQNMQFVILRIRIGNRREYSNIQWHWLVATGSSYIWTTMAIEHSNLLFYRTILGWGASMQQVFAVGSKCAICCISPLPNKGPQNSSQYLHSAARNAVIAICHVAGANFVLDPSDSSCLKTGTCSCVFWKLLRLGYLLHPATQSSS